MNAGPPLEPDACCAAEAAQESLVRSWLSPSQQGGRGWGRAWARARRGCRREVTQVSASPRPRPTSNSRPPDLPRSQLRKLLAAGPEASGRKMTDAADRAAYSRTAGPSNLFTNLFKSLTVPQHHFLLHCSSSLNSRSRVSNLPPRPLPLPYWLSRHRLL